jgi:hypothetical protein
VLKRARIVFQILNVSETGALIFPSNIILCRKEFVLKPDIGDARTVK